MSILKSSSGIESMLQQRLNCALSASFPWAPVSFDSEVFAAYLAEIRISKFEFRKLPELAVDLLQPAPKCR